MTSASLLTRSYTPLAFRPDSERLVAFGLAGLSGILWCLVIPLEFVLA